LNLTPECNLVQTSTRVYKLSLEDIILGLTFINEIEKVEFLNYFDEIIENISSSSFFSGLLLF